MSKVLMIVGILLAALGLTIGLMVTFSPGGMQAIGITPEVAVELLVGGFVTLGLGAVVDAVQRSGAGELRERLVRHETEASPLPSARTTGGIAATTAAVGAAAAAAAAESARVSTSVPSAAEAAGRVFEPARTRAEEVTASIKSDAEQMIAEARRAAAETSAKLDEAKAQLESALSPEEITIPAGARATAEQSVEEIVAAVPELETESVEPEQEIEPEAEPEMVEAPEAEDEAAEDQLYVVEERMIRGRPARILSDSTVEAETDEGWMRFENLEHLEEYLDAMSPGRA